MGPSLTVYIDRLREGKEENISYTLPPTFLEIEEKDLQCKDPISVQGKAYLAAEDHLVLTLCIHTKVALRCSICNEWSSIAIYLPKWTHTRPLGNRKTTIYQYGSAMREEILLEVPNYVECKGNCPERKELKKYLLKKETTGSKLTSTVFPFADLT